MLIVLTLKIDNYPKGKTKFDNYPKGKTKFDNYPEGKTNCKKIKILKYCNN